MDTMQSDIDQAAKHASQAFDLAKRHIENSYKGPAGQLAVATLAAAIIQKLNMMHDCDMRYIEMDRADRRTLKDRSSK